jgi:hypothetical protein
MALFDVPEKEWLRETQRQLVAELSALDATSPLLAGEAVGELVVDDSGYGFMEPEYVRVADGWMARDVAPKNVTPPQLRHLTHEREAS